MQCIFIIVKYANLETREKKERKNCLVRSLIDNNKANAYGKTMIPPAADDGGYVKCGGSVRFFVNIHTDRLRN